jgi:hypothetical protein
MTVDLVAYSCLQWAKHSNVAGLELVGSMRGNTAQDDVVFKSILQDFERLVRPEPITNQNPWLVMRLRFGLGIEYTFEPFQADLRVCVSGFKARIMPTRGGLRGPIASMGCGWPYNHWKERPTVCRYTLY